MVGSRQRQARVDQQTTISNLSSRAATQSTKSWAMENTTVAYRPPPTAQIDPHTQRIPHRPIALNTDEEHIAGSSPNDFRFLSRANLASMRKRLSLGHAQNPGFQSTNDCFQSMAWSAVSNFLGWIVASSHDTDGSIGCTITGDCVVSDDRGQTPG
ncbi:hypothetical protein H2200_006132 [Cladophialophora chaetospira]|uniref:Uncharacterized protein n=1 Tax=Cladophialophora chaetospira TaxID=386627 RepID=A0AA38XAC8_9EURO|nr:hypothetical protein H2200_006132 [Cladophialophora chaetospira]